MKKHRTISFATVILALSLGHAGAVLAQPVAGISGPANPPDGPLGVPPGSSVLFDQTGSPAVTAYTSQNFEAAFDANDSQLADDFVVTDAAGWTVTQVNVLGLNGGPPVPAANIWIYADNAGSPGAAVCTYLAMPVTDDGVGNLEAVFTNPCVLAGSSTYWLSVQADMDFGAFGQWFWYDSLVPTGNVAHWQNPGDGFATGCTTWTPKVPCLVTGEDDLAFSIAGYVGAPASRATFEVEKSFVDDNTTEVEVSISCNTGLPLEQSKMIAQGDVVTFVVTDFDDGELDCEVTETSGPDGYLTLYFPNGSSSSSDCEFEDIGFGFALSCRIVNHPLEVDVVIDKEWVFEGTGASSISTEFELYLVCDAEITDGDECGLLAAQAAESPLSEPAQCILLEGEGDTQFTVKVIPNFPSSSCYVAEPWVDMAVEVSNGCEDLTISAGVGDSCTITNTVFFEGIPTLNQYGLAILALLMLGIGFVGFRRFA